MLDSMTKLVLNEVIESDRQVDTDSAIRGLHQAGNKVALYSPDDDVDSKDEVIECLVAIIDAITYLSIVNKSADACRSLLKEEGGASC